MNDPVFFRRMAASSVGMTVLANGGNAVDAAMAVGFAIGVAEPKAPALGETAM